MQGQNLALPERSVLQAQTLVQMMAPVIAEESSDGLGYAIEYLSNGVKMLWHTGDIQGWRGQYALFPDLGEGIIVLTNNNTSRYFIAATICSWSQWAAQAMPGVCQVYGIILIATPTLAIFLFVLILISAVRLGLELQSGKRRVEWPPKNVLHNRDIILPLLMIFLWWLFVSPRMVGIMPPAVIWISLGFTVWCLVVALNSFMIKVGTNNL